MSNLKYESYSVREIPKLKHSWCYFKTQVILWSAQDSPLSVVKPGNLTNTTSSSKTSPKYMLGHILRDLRAYQRTYNWSSWSYFLDSFHQNIDLSS